MKKHVKILTAAAAVITVVAAAVSPVSTEETPQTESVIREKLRQRAAALELERERAREMGLEIRGPMPGGGLFELKTLSTRVPTYFITCNDAAAKSTRTDSVQAVFGGAPGFTIGLWDGGSARTTHQELAGRAVCRDESSCMTHPHSTHVAGTLIGAGVVPRAKGMAYQARIVSYEWSFDDLEAEIEAGNGLLLSNHSYGHARGWVVSSSGTVYWYGDVSISETEDYLFGFYSDVSRDWDAVANRNPHYLPVTSAGNDRNDGVPPGTSHYYWDPESGGWITSTAVRDDDGGELGYDCIPDGMSTAKNTLVIGAVMDVDEYNGPEDVEMTTFSSWGPTDDGRIKPDICGNGYMLYSAVDDNDAAYGVYSGTSMASPNVCGSLALLQACYAQARGDSMLASTVKALAIHTAREAGPHPGPDYGFGWGLLDTWAAYELIESDADGRMGRISELTLYEGMPLELYYEPDGGAARMTVTIAWNDPVSEIPEPALNDRTPLLVNDVDLRVEGAGREYSPWTLDPDDPAAPAGRGDNFRDNVEQVVIEDPAPGTYTVRLNHKGPLSGGSQVVSVIVSGARRARTWHVFADGSGDAPTIGEAVSLASPGDQIFVFPGTYREHDILVGKPLTIRGMSGATATRIDAGGSGRCFSIASSGIHGVIEIDGFTFTGGFADASQPRGRGGAIYCDGAGAVISSCVFTGNRAEYGGAIYLMESNSQVIKCDLHDNEAGSGGGIFLFDSDALIEGAVISHNGAELGGGICALRSSPLVSGCTVSHNSAQYGSGVYTGDGAGAKISSTIVSFGYGIGVYAEDISSVPSVECCDIYSNEGGNYGGALHDQTGKRGNMSEDPLFCGPHAIDFSVGDGSPCLPGRNDCGTLTGARGAGCHTLSLIRVEPDGTGDAATIAAAVAAAVDGDTILLAPGVYTGPGNRDIITRGVRMVVTSEGGAGATVIDCGAGGDAYYGFYFAGGEDTSTVLEGITITGAGKGAIACFYESSPLIRDCVLTGNRHMGGWHGGGLIVETSSEPVVRRCVISGNSGSPHGGGIFSRAANPILEDCEITGNSATDSGGGIGIMSGSVLAVRRCVIDGNEALDGSGGGVYLIMSSGALHDSEITGNTADYAGGGISNDMNSSLTVTGTLIAGNSSANLGGGVYSTFNMTMSYCTVADNYTGFYGAGIECYRGDQNHIDNTIVAFNRNAHGIFTITADMDIACSDVYGNEGGDYGGATADMTGALNISEDPLFCGAESGDYHLGDSSPALAAPDPSCTGGMGALGVRCGSSADLLFSSVSFDTTEAEVGRTISISATIRNAGTVGAGSFRVDLYDDLDAAPVHGSLGDQYGTVDTLSPGDSASVFFEIMSAEAGEWSTWLLIDTDGRVPELNTDNNTDGPHAVTWTVPGGGLPGRSKLYGISPNPFNDSTEIAYDLDRRTSAEISIFDSAGRHLKIWKLPPMGPGRFSVTWAGTTDGGRKVASGVYFIRFRVDGVAEQSAKIVLIR